MQTPSQLPESNLHPFFSANPLAQPDNDDRAVEENDSATPQLAKIPLLIIEDHQSLLDGIRPSLEQEYDVTIVGNGIALRQALGRKRFALATVDLTLERHLEGLEIMPLLKDAGTKFLVFSGTAEEWHIRAAMRFGALGYVDKREKLQNLHDALQTIAAGKLAFTPKLLENLRQRKDQHFPFLGPAEMQAIDFIVSHLHLVTGGMPTNKVIAKGMNLSTKRVEHIIRELTGKFRLRQTTRTALLSELKERGYFPGASKASFGELGLFS